MAACLGSQGIGTPIRAAVGMDRVQCQQGRGAPSVVTQLAAQLESLGLTELEALRLALLFAMSDACKGGDADTRTGQWW